MAGTVTAMFLLVMIILITSFQIAIYGDSEYRFYEKEYRKYRVTEDLHMSMENVMKVTDYMMDYLIGREEVLSVKTEVDSRCPSSSDPLSDSSRTAKEGKELPQTPQGNSLSSILRERAFLHLPCEVCPVH